jgi:hypothetical protein
MSTNWSETAADICRDALEHMNVIGANDAVPAVDMNKALRALNAVLKALPLNGYTWPKLSSDVSLAWSSGTPQTVALPSDYYSYPVVRRTSDGSTVPLTQIPHSAWAAMLNREQTATHPTHFYIAPDKTLYFWPIPTQDPEATLQYQKLTDDAVSNAATDMPQYWISPLGWGVADELCMDYGVTASQRLEINQRWTAKKATALESSISYEPIIVSVDDGCNYPR